MMTMTEYETMLARIARLECEQATPLPEVLWATPVKRAMRLLTHGSNLSPEDISWLAAADTWDD
jgi:hypothetical protein